jgi:hypothetical protein
MEPQQGPTDSHWAACPQCGRPNRRGAARCAHCARLLRRPPLLNWITILGPVAMVLLAVAYAMGVGENAGCTPGFAISCTGVVILSGLRFGHHWAWLAVQVQCLFELLVLGIQGLENHPLTAVGAVAHGLLIVLLWCYVQTRQVRSYCGVRPVPRPAEHPDADLLEDPEALDEAEDDLHDRQRKP